MRRYDYCKNLPRIPAKAGDLDTPFNISVSETKKYCYLIYQMSYISFIVIIINYLIKSNK